MSILEAVTSLTYIKEILYAGNQLLTINAIFLRIENNIDCCLDECMRRKGSGQDLAYHVQFGLGIHKQAENRHPCTRSREQRRPFFLPKMLSRPSKR